MFISLFTFNYRLPYGGLRREERDYVAMHAIWLGLIFKRQNKPMVLNTAVELSNVNLSKQLNVASDIKKNF